MYHDSIIEFICYKEEDGRSNNVVKSILCEDNEHLWISTNIGLNRFNIKNKKFRVFNSYDGLSFEDFAYAGYKTQN